MDEKKEAVAQETEAVEENSTQEAVEKTEEAKQEEAQKELIRQLKLKVCLLYTSPSPRDRQKSRMPSSA